MNCSDDSFIIYKQVQHFIVFENKNVIIKFISENIVSFSGNYKK